MNRLVRGSIVLVSLMLIWLLPVPAGLTVEAWHIFAIFAAVILGFILQPMPLGAVALAGVTYPALIGLLKPSEVLAGFSNTTIWLIISAFLFAKGFIKTGLGKRIAYKLIFWFGSSSLKLSYTLVISDFIISPATPSNTARSGGIMFPIVRSLASVFDSEPGPTARKIGAFLLAVSFQADAPIAAIFLTACAPNPLMATLAKQTANLDITWGLWAIAGIVPGIISIIVIPFFLYRTYTPEIKDTPEAQQLAGKELKNMGEMTHNEKIISGVFIGALLLWSTSQYTHIDATIVALLGVSVMLIFHVLEWEDVISEKGAWDSMMWMGGIIGLAEALNKSGFIQWFAQNVTQSLNGVSWVITLGVLFLVYLYSHYAFASLSAHATAIYAPFLAVAVAAGAPPYFAAIGLAVLSNLMAGLTHYATGAAPVYFGAGFIGQKDWWRIGFTCSIINFIIWIGIGSLWWKLIGIW
ncbi:anion permease [Pectinatus haikarae]|uniref:DASS family divalent anion:Na+ symporter n=1 Tax=Pectinatus haikarae TaxID=349096 RepID=A0ABT9YB85_9FIRM|nr:anion permease [Pectinatus haikarae]MDQ0205067.1 DASS family divalent anion:Na+ symporter [Pectinatus haikarae]